jgi:hypothetical protein
MEELMHSDASTRILPQIASAGIFLITDSNKFAHRVDTEARRDLMDLCLADDCEEAGEGRYDFRRGVLIYVGV